MASPDGFIEITDLNKWFVTGNQSIQVLENVSFSIRKGEFVTIVGPSGCGKSTLMKMVVGLIRKSSGSIKLAGEEVNGPIGGVGVVFQNPALLGWRKVLKNVLLPIEILGLEGEEGLSRARKLLHLTGLESFENYYPNQLSGGMQQRVAICRALIHNPELLLMDEPFGALDAFTREQLNLELMKIWQTERKTVIFITHSIPEAIFLADKVVVMSPRPGRVIDVIDVNLQRPRTLDQLTSAEFSKLALTIRKQMGLTEGAPTIQ